MHKNGKPTNHLSIQQLSLKTGLSSSALNYYTSVGLIAVADRHGNKRLYNQAQVKRVETIQRLRREGYPLRIIWRHLNEGVSLGAAG